MGYIYCLTSPSGKKYVGMTSSTVESRWSTHIRDARLRTNKSAIQNAIRKHGADSFVVETLAEEDDLRELCLLEAYWIERLGTLAPGGYNLKGGGESGYAFTDEAKKKISDGVARARLDPEVVRKHAEGTRRAQNTPEYKKKRSALSSEFWSVESNRERQRSVMKEHWSDGSRAEKYSARMKSTWKDAEYRKKVEDGLRNAAPCVSIEGTVYRSASDAAEALKLPKYTVSYRLRSPIEKWKGWFNVKE